MYKIRRAAIKDCRELAQIQVDSYRASYAGVFPQTYLERFSYEEQEQDWLAMFTTNPDDLLFVAESQARIVGYVLARVQANVHPGYDAEIIALHVQQPFQRRGIGAALLHKARQTLKTRGCQSVMLWTLEENPVRLWYERLGANVIAEKSYRVEDCDITEIAYGWQEPV